MMKTIKTIYLIGITILFFVTYLSDNQAEEYAQTGLPDGAYARLGKGNINVMRFTPSGTHLVVGTDIGLLIYDIKTGAETILSVGEKMKNQILAFTPDGRILACSGRDEYVINYWDWKNKKLLNNLTITHHFSGIADMNFVDNNTLIFLSNNGVIRKWNIKSNQEISKRQYNNRKSVKVISQDGSYYASGDPIQGRIRIWSFSQDELGSELIVKTDGIIQKSIKNLFNSDNKNDKNKNGITNIAISPDEKQIASIHKDNIVRLWDINSNKQRTLFRLQSGHMNTLTFSFDNKYLAISKTDKTILIWDLVNGRSHTILKGHKKSIHALAFSPNEYGLIASGSSDGTIRLWNSITGVEQGVIATGYSDLIKAIAFTMDNNSLYTATDSGLVKHWHAKTGKEIGTPFYSEEDCFIAVTFSHDMQYLAYQGGSKVPSKTHEGYSLNLSEKGIRLWYIPAWIEKITIPTQTLSLSYSPNNRMVATTSFNDGNQLWDVNTGVKSDQFIPENGRFRIPVFSTNGDILVVYGSHQPIEAWNILTKESVPVANNNDIFSVAFPVTNNHYILSVAFSNNSKLLATKNFKGIVLYDVAPTGITYNTSLFSYENSGSGRILLFSLDDKILLESHSNSDGYTIRLWDIDRKTEMGAITGHVNYIQTLAFSHDGKILASSGSDGVVLLWDWDKIKESMGLNKK
ncbi:hypothetical protein C6497_04150 [Candidatus Poribacteria bacterium]|nr:MAG: hypothetical protein C6497_04150 [Candidatus Poribacteria bacterium]